MHQRYPHLLCLIMAMSMIWISQNRLQAESLKPLQDSETSELIVLLAPTLDAMPLADQAVRGIQQRGFVPGSLAFGAPDRARFALPFRAVGTGLGRLRTDPDSPRARLERYVVLRYLQGTDLDRVQEALKADPRVLHVEENLRFAFSLVPNDPLLSNTGNPSTHQWGSHALNLPAAWDHVKGHSYVGLIDSGLEVAHPDLTNFREHFSYDFGDDDPCVDERGACSGPAPPGSPSAVGHGSHVSGLVAATTNNGQGSAGTCWNCSLMMAKNRSLGFADSAASLTFLVDHGVQIVSMSFGVPDLSCAGASGSLGMFCTAIAYGDYRSVLMTAASGNDKSDINFPARDPQVMAIGGIESDLSFWDEAPNCPLPGDQECGSNYTMGSALQDLVAPAKSVLSTMYTGFDWNPGLGCGDSTFPDPGYGLCTGTSMASPYVAGLAGLIRSINPLLTKEEVRDALITTADGDGSWDPMLGYGIPDADEAAEKALGTADGQVLVNRLAPLFSLYSTPAEDFFYTTVPQMASAAIWTSTVGYASVGSAVPGYDLFPHGCPFSPCDPLLPKASVFVLTTYTAPYPGAPVLVPLYRLSFEGPNPVTGNPLNRDTVYTTEQAGIDAFVAVGYRLDGIEGYIFPRSGSQPSGTVRLFRKYNPARDDHAIFPESELATMQALGYTQNSGDDWIGYVYPNTDSDFDDLIDGFEDLAGTDTADPDSDGDGLADGQEVLEYPYSDPLNAACSNDLIFADPFEIVGTPQWDAIVAVNGGTIEVSEKAAYSSYAGLLACSTGPQNGKALVWDMTPNTESRYRARFYFSPAQIEIDSGAQHSLFVLRSASNAIVRVDLKRTASGFWIRAQTQRDDNSWLLTSWYSLSGGWQPIEIDWRASDALIPNGHLKLWLGGLLQEEITGVDNDLKRVEDVLLGAVAGVDSYTKGCHLIDVFESRRCSYIGP